MRKAHTLTSYLREMARLCPYFIIVFPFLLAGCSENAPTSPGGAGSGTVYIAGWVDMDSNGAKATIWKNGVANILPGTGNSMANAVFVHKGDVYAAGVSVITNTSGYSVSVATYWKNGTKYVLSNVTSFAKDIWVSGNNVIVVGTLSYSPNGSGDTAAIWINGNQQTLSSYISHANACFVSGSDVYVGGMAPQGHRAIWKNGMPQLLGTSDGGYVTDIFVSGNDVYASCSQVSYSSYGFPSRWTQGIWKNGQKIHELTGNNITNISSLFVSNNTVYAVGRYNNVATYWKNGVATQMPFFIPEGISVYNNEVHIVGSVGSNYSIRAIYYKNGTPYTLSAARSEAYGIYIVGQ